jgi:hypothetical protein
MKKLKPGVEKKSLPKKKRCCTTINPIPIAISAAENMRKNKESESSSKLSRVSAVVTEKA